MKFLLEVKQCVRCLMFARSNSRTLSFRTGMWNLFQEFFQESCKHYIGISADDLYLCVKSTNLAI